VAIVDPGMPAWIKDMFNARLPDLFHEYAKRFGSRLPWKPVVLFSFQDDGSPGYSSGGGTLTGLVNMTLAGSAWRTTNAAAAEQAFHLIAHESAHLWNGQLVASDPSSAGSWMHEGGADAMANEMLGSFGIIDSARYRIRREEALNKCAAAVASGSVESALNRGAERTVYDCGFVMALWTEAAVAQAHSGATMFTFWRALVEAAQKNKGGYDEALYFAVLREAGVSDATVSRMRTFLASRDSIAVAVAGLQEAGIAVRSGQGAPPASYQQEVGRTAMIHVMQQACGRVNFSWGVPVRTGVVATCAPFASELLVFQIQGFRVRDQGAAVHDAVRAACAAREAIALLAEDGRSLTTVPCTRPLLPRPTWFEVPG